MKMKLATAFAVLLFASMVRADEIGTTYGAVYIPDGSTVTSISYVPGYIDAIVSFTFADGTGVANALGVFSATGSINFTTPVCGLSFDWYGPGWWATDNLGDVYTPPIEAFSGGEPSTGTATFAGPGISSIEWATEDNFSVAGIESMTYTLDSTDPPGVPEPSSLLLSGLGLAALIGLARCNRANDPKAMI
jgi:hypothetical protein